MTGSRSEFGTSKRQVGPKLLTEGKQLSNRIRKELAELDPQYVVLACLTDRDFDLDDVVRQLDQANLPHAKCALLLDGTEVRRIFVYENDQVVSSLAALFPSVSAESRARPVLARQQAGTSPTGSVPTVPQVVDNPVIIDDRVRRMVRLSIISNRATILVHALVMAAVEALTELPKQPGQNRAARKALYADQIAEAGWIAQFVKVADLIDNTSTIAELDPDFWRVYRVEKRSMLEKIAASPSWLGKPAWVSDELMQRAWQQTEEST